MAVKSSHWAAWVWVILIIGVVVAMMGYSAHLNWRYGREFFGGNDLVGSRAFATGFALTDVAKFIMAVLPGLYWRKGSVWAALGMIFLVFLGSLLSVTAMLNIGFQGSENSLAKVRAERQTLNDLRARRVGLNRQIEELGTMVPPSMIEHQMQALRRDRRWQSTDGCTDVTAAASRIFCADYDRLFARLAAATKSKRLQADTEKLSSMIRSLTNADAVRDPRRVMSITAAWLGLDVDTVGLGQLLAFAIVVELFGVALSAVAGAQVASLRTVSAQASVPSGPTAGDAAANTQGRPQWRWYCWTRSCCHVGTASASSDPVGAAGSDAGRLRWATSDRRPTIKWRNGSARSIGDTRSRIVQSLREAVPSRVTEDACPIEFWDDVIVPAPGGHIPARELYEGYEIWSRRRGSHPLPQARFGKTLTNDRGAQRRKSNGRMLYVDVALVSQFRLPAEGGLNEIPPQQTVPEGLR